MKRRALRELIGVEVASAIGMEWAMFFLFFGLKVPLIALCWLVWWAIHQVDDPAGDGGDGGSRVRPHPPAPLPRLPRRGPHGDPALPAPPRIRPAAVRARELTQRTSSAGTGER